MRLTDNYIKHTTKNPIQRMLINRFLDQLISVINNLKVSSILDVGCGEGFTLTRIQRGGKIKAKLEGIDYLDSAIKLGKKVNPSLSLKKGNIYKLPYKNNSFDLVLCTEVLEHLEDPQKGLQELVRITKKYSLISVPNEPLFMLANFIRGNNWSRWGNDVEHIQHWSSFGFEKFISQNNLNIIQKHHPFPWTMILGDKQS